MLFRKFIFHNQGLRNYRKSTMLQAAKYLKILLWLIALHSFTAGVLLIVSWEKVEYNILVFRLAINSSRSRAVYFIL